MFGLHTGVDLGHFELGAFVVMSNHVHALLRPLIAAARLNVAPSATVSALSELPDLLRGWGGA